MKTFILIILTIAIACTSLFLSAEAFGKQLKAQHEAGLCIKEKIALGVPRSQIEVVGNTCFNKGE